MGPQGPKTLIFVNFLNGCSLYPFAFFGGVVVVWHCTAIAAQLAICEHNMRMLSSLLISISGYGQALAFAPPITPAWKAQHIASSPLFMCDAAPADDDMDWREMRARLVAGEAGNGRRCLLHGFGEPAQVLLVLLLLDCLLR